MTKKVNINALQNKFNKTINFNYKLSAYLTACDTLQALARCNYRNIGQLLKTFLNSQPKLVHQTQFHSDAAYTPEMLVCW